MNHKEDIGKLFKQKLDNAAKELDVDLWDKIEATLDRRDRKRRRFFFFWIGTGAATIMMLLLYINSVTSVKQDLIQDNTTNKIATKPLNEVPTISELNSEKNNAITILDTTAGDSLNKFVQKELNESISTENILATPKRSLPYQNNETKEKDPFMDDSVTIKTTYHYYNGSTKEMLETTDKSVIDSLLKRTE